MLVGGGILLYKLFGPEKEPQPIPPAAIPGGEENLPPNWDPREMAEALRKAMEGPAILQTQIDFRTIILTNYLALPDPQFVSVYNYFNTHLGGGKSLKEWIKGEYGLGYLGDQLIVRFNSFTPKLRGVNGWLTTPGIDPANQFFNWNYLTWKNQYKKVANDLNTDLDILSRS